MSTTKSNQGNCGWNTYRHLELYYAVPCMGAMLHTLNIRLFAEQLVYIINEAEDKIIFVDGDLVPLLEKVANQIPSVKLFVIMGEAPYATGKLQPSIDYETFIADAPTTYDWPKLDENTAAAMCYTSGTTANPKGVIYSHRSVFLHSMGVGLADGPGLSEHDTVLPIVPMFHANAWGFAHAAVMMGANIVFPGTMIPGVDFRRAYPTNSFTKTSHDKRCATFSSPCELNKESIADILHLPNWNSVLTIFLCTGTQPSQMVILHRRSTTDLQHRLDRPPLARNSGGNGFYEGL